MLVRVTTRLYARSAGDADGALNEGMTEDHTSPGKGIYVGRPDLRAAIHA